MHKDIIFRQLRSPVFQNKVYETQEAARSAVLGDVELVQSTVSGLVYNQTFDSSLLEYDRDYQNEQACSSAFREHLAQVLDILLGEFGYDKKGIEIGCGKGYFLDLLSNAGAEVIGFDPAYEGSNPRVVKKLFQPDPTYQSPDYFILRHVLEHIEQPWSFLSELRNHCKPGARIYIEVPCFEWIVSHEAFYDVFYEHVNYFTMDVLRHAFGVVTKAGRLFGGQYLFILADLSTFHEPTQYGGRSFGKLDLDGYLHKLLDKRSSATGKTFIWGAGAKGITLSTIFSRNAVAVDGLIDINPAKQGRFAGGSGLPIHAPSYVMHAIEDADIFVMNPVYLPEITSMLSSVNARLIPVA
jgi:SAM-dependent methyltransferase